MADPMTSSDDALRAAVERVRAFCDWMESDDAVTRATDGMRIDDLRLILSALTAPPDTRQSGFVTEEMVERGARAMCASKGYPPDEFYHAQGETTMRMWQFFKEDARAVLAAAGGGK